MKISEQIRWEELHKKANVVSVGWGQKYKNGVATKDEAICIGVAKKVSLASLKAEDLIPRVIDGMLTDVWETGIFKVPFVTPREFNERYRPAPGGVSIGHPDITAGTLACLCKRNGDLCILTNNHVGANSNNAEIGDPWYQPGPYDGGTEKDAIAKLLDFVQIQFQGMPEIPCLSSKVFKYVMDIALSLIRSSYRITFYRDFDESINKVDAALAEVDHPSLVKSEILKIGKIAGITEGNLGLKIQKSGRTTEHTTGEITQTEVSVQVSYGDGKMAMFEDQLMAGKMCAGGDSGSAILDMQNRICGLLFAGSDTSTVINRIQNVVELLKIEGFVSE